MSAAIGTEAWLGFIQHDYLEEFISAGGSSIKFVVPLSEDERQFAKSELVVRAQELGFLTCTVSADETRVHMVDKLYFRVAEQIPWSELCELVLARLAREAKYTNAAMPGEAPFSVRLSEANEVEATMVGMQMRSWIANEVLKNHTLLRDFRVAVSQLCLAHLFGGPQGGTMAAAVEDWLTGQNQSVSSVKPYSIYNKITRANARLMLESLLKWVQYAEKPGTILMLDIERLAIARRTDDGLPFYTKAQLLDAYEVLRQFIDGTERLRGCLLVVFPAIEFLDIEPSSRGMGAYDALKFRVYDEVHDQRLANPMSALVRLASQSTLP